MTEVVSPNRPCLFELFSFFLLDKCNEGIDMFTCFKWSIVWIKLRLRGSKKCVFLLVWERRRKWEGKRYHWLYAIKPKGRNVVFCYAFQSWTLCVWSGWSFLLNWGWNTRQQYEKKIYLCPLFLFDTLWILGLVQIKFRVLSLLNIWCEPQTMWC